ncbi:MAG: UvrB/UvrC motif-containing protein, partial [bacterium]
ILDADNEGFLRSETTLIQIAGRAARNVGGEVFLYADRITGSMKRATDEMQRRRTMQVEYNRIHKITPRTIRKATHDLEEFEYKAKKAGFALLHDAPGSRISPKNLPRLMQETEKQMKEAADILNFELAAELRDRLFELKEMKAQKNPAKR